MNHHLVPVTKQDPEIGFPEQSRDLGKLSPFCNFGYEVDFKDDHENYPMINYINHILMEENLEEHPILDLDPIALQAAEKSFYDVLTKNFDPSSQHRNSSIVSPSIDDSNIFELSGLGISHHSNLHVSEKPISILTESDDETVLQFNRGLKEGKKFLPTSGQQVLVDMSKQELPSKSKRIVTGSKSKKHHCQDNYDDSNHQNNSKHAALSNEDTVELSETFDRVLLYGDSKFLISPSNGFLGDEKKGHNMNVEAVDLVTLLFSCAQSIALVDRITAIEQLIQIRKHASSNGDQYQRLAFIFANALEARLTCAGPDLYAAHLSKRVSAAEELKAMRVHLCLPVGQISSFLANTMIMEAISNSKTLHIVDFGITYGFHWPNFIQLLSKRPGGPPKLRITGIDTPQSGFKPDEKLEDTGRRLAKYCGRFDVPFEYKSLAIKNWERIKVEDLNLTRNEVVAVNCQFVHRKLYDETTGNENKNPRDAVLCLIREMKPDILINNSINCSFSTFFFLSRFKEALFYFESIFDCLDVILPREDLQRMKFEQNFLGPEVLNVVACEGSARVYRPETYKHWQARYTRAGFRILPLNPDLVKGLKKKTREGYHKDFMLFEEDNWLLLAWKGKVISANSCWVPTVVQSRGRGSSLEDHSVTS